MLSRCILEADPDYNSLTLDDKLRRLAIVDRERLDFKMKELQKEYLSKFSFKPQINENSKILAKPKNVTELADITEKEQRLMEKKQKLEEERMKECKFKPQLTKSRTYQNVSSFYTKENYDRKLKEATEKKRIEVPSILTFIGRVYKKPERIQ